MKTLRWLAVSLALIVALLGVGVGWWFVSSSQPDVLGQHQPPAGLDTVTLNTYAGVYQTNTGKDVLLAPSAKGGLALYEAENYAFERDSILAEHIYRQNNAWVMKPPGDSLPHPIQFTLVDEEVTSFTWEDDVGTRHTATRSLSPPYAVRAVEFESDVSLSGTLFLPLSDAPVPGAVLIHGSGDSDRDGLWYVLVARVLAERGIAVLLPDKRGSGRSSGEWRTASFEDLAKDALAAFRVLRARPEVDASQIGVVGMSQGGRIAPLVASRSSDVAFVVNVVGATVTPREQVQHEIRQQVRDAGVPNWLAPALMPLTTRMPARRQPAWWASNGDFDPMPLWRNITQPALVIYGAEDEHDNVPVGRSVELLRSLDKSKSQLEVMIVPGVGHALARPETDELDPMFRSRLVEWIKNR